MDFTFLKATGEVAFFRSDAEQADWTQEEMSLLCTFPFKTDKTIERGMIVLFQDPATNDWQAYEIRNCSLFVGENYQQFTAEDLAVSELTDCHVSDDIEMSDITAESALNQVLSGTGWNVGTNEDSGISFADIGRGSVWQAVCTIRNNWNVHIMPRVTVNASGIVGKYIDIFQSSGVWRGCRIAVNKNVSDPCVIYDDSELYTALYGYGASYSVGDVGNRETLETNFADIAWEQTADHPAKPEGQKYIEDPAKTALYGRNGKPRFGYYQNGDIDDPETLLQKTWESLKACFDPKISISGTVADLKRLGYADQPIRLHDMVIVDLEPTGLQFYKQIIQLTVDLLNPEKNTPNIGDYIPNIIYINRQTEDYATGGGGGRGGGTRSKKKQGQFETNIQQNERNIILNAIQTKENGDKLRAAGIEIDPITGVVIYAEDVENGIGANFKVTNNMITSEVEERKKGDNSLSSRITQNANSITLEVTERKNGETTLNSKITQTATQIRSEVRDAVDGLESSITQTATEIRSEVSDSIDGVESSITETATEIRSEVSDSVSGLQSSITQNANKIAIVVNSDNSVNAASIVAGINNQDKQSSSYVDISADYINLTGYVTVTDLNATNAEINNLKTGATTATLLKAQRVSATNISFNGSNLSTTTLNYKDHSGVNQSLKIVYVPSST